MNSNTGSYSAPLLGGNIDNDLILPPVPSFDAFLFIFLSLFHIPLIPIRGESIGGYDIYLVSYILLRTTVLKPALQIDRRWIVFYFFSALSLLYHSIWLVFSAENKALPMILKQLELVLAFIVAGDLVLRHGVDRILRALRSAFLLLVMYSGLAWAGWHGYLPLPGFLLWGDWYRIGLPFMDSVSSNPAGFVYGGFLIVLSYTMVGRQTTSKIILWFLCFILFFFTLSRTNLLALAVVLVAMSLLHSRQPLRNTAILAICIAVMAAIFSSLIRYVPTSNRLWMILKLIQNPAALLTDRSFSLRYNVLWPRAFSAWLHSPLTMLFGTGLDAQTIVDGTLPRLLGNEGLLGLVLFLLLWVVYFVVWFPGNRIMLALVLFIILNGISAETMILSYRSSQVMALFLVFAGSWVPTSIPNVAASTQSASHSHAS